MNLSTLMACATCHEALTEHRQDGQVTFRHPIIEKDHRAVPVGAGRVGQVSNRCHTCSDGLPVWDYLTLIDWIHSSVVRRSSGGFM